MTHSQSRDSGAGAPWTHCKDGEGAKNSSWVPRVSQSMSEPRAANPASPPLWAVSLVLRPTCWWDLWSQFHSSLLPSVNYFSPKSLLIFCFHISKRGGFCGLVFLIGFGFGGFFALLFKWLLLFSLVREWNTYRRKHPFMAVITRKRTPKSKGN